MYLKDRLIAGSVAEKDYLKDRKAVHAQPDFKPADLAKVEQEFISKLSDLKFTSIGDYQTQVKLYGHFWRSLKVAEAQFGSDGLVKTTQETIPLLQDALVSHLYDHTVVYVPDATKAELWVDTHYCKRKKIEIISHLSSGGANITFPGNVGIMPIIHRPSLGEGMAKTLRNVISAVLFSHYGVEATELGNDLLYKDTKICGTGWADMGKISISPGSLTLKFDPTVADSTLKKDKVIKKPHSLNDLIGYKIDPNECLQLLIAEWAKQTNSMVV